MTGPTPQQVLALARAVAPTGERGQLLNADNSPQLQDKTPIYLPLEQAVTCGAAFIVRPRQGVIALDADAVDGQPPAWLDQARSFCAEQGCYLVEVTSGGASGGHHLWVVLPVGWSNREFADALRQAVPSIPAGQVRHTQATRPPLSIHRSGSWPQLVYPATPAEALAILAGRRPFQTEKVSDGVQRLLREGVTQGSRTHALLSIALGYVNAGQDLNAFTRALLDPAHVGGQVVREMPPAKRDKTLAEVWAKACRKVRESPAIEGETRRRQLAAVRATAAGYPFSGKHLTDQLVYSLLVALTAWSRSVEVTCSTRMLAERTGRSRRRVLDALARLRDQHQLIKLLEPGRGLMASRWLLLSKPDVSVTTALPLGGPETSSGDISSAFGVHGLHPAFGGSRGLPAGAAVLWDRMDIEVDRYTVTELMQLRSGPSRPVVLRQLEALHAAGLVDRNKPRGHYWRKLPGDDRLLDRVARGNGNVERAQQQREQHQLDRQVYKNRGRVEQAPKVRCAGTTKDGEPCQSTALPTGPRTRAAHCRAHASEDDRARWNAWRDAKAHPERLALAT